jgi:hypothetical protein
VLSEERCVPQPASSNAATAALTIAILWWDNISPSDRVLVLP